MSNDRTRTPSVVLAEWRAAESHLADLEEGSVEWHRVRLVAQDLAHEYQVVVAERSGEAAELAGEPERSTGAEAPG